MKNKTTCRYTDPELLEAWFSGTLQSAERAAVALHLESGCESCDTLIAEMRSLDEIMSGRAAAITAAGASGGAEIEVETAQRERALNIVMSQVKAPARSGLWAGLKSSLSGMRFVHAAGAALVALLMIAVVVSVIISSEGEGRRAKGVGHFEGGITIWFDIQRDGGMIRGEDGVTCSQADRIIFHFQLDAPGFVTLFMSEEQGPFKRLMSTPQALAAGTHVLTAPTGVLAYALDGHSGDLGFLAVISDDPQGASPGGPNSAGFSIKVISLGGQK